jgi:ketosteroid isomerase-like protein
VHRLAAFLSLLLASTIPAASSAAPTAAQAVLSVEQSWLKAYAERDVNALGQILAPDFVHINYAGALRHRDDELRSLSAPHEFTEHLSDEVVSFAGPVAIVHGVNGVTKDGRTVVRLRFTDVFVQRDGTWQAVSAQETPMR